MFSAARPRGHEHGILSETQGSKAAAILNFRPLCHRDWRTPSPASTIQCFVLEMAHVISVLYLLTKTSHLGARKCNSPRSLGELAALVESWQHQWSSQHLE